MQLYCFSVPSPVLFLLSADRYSRYYIYHRHSDLFQKSLTGEGAAHAPIDDSNSDEKNDPTTALHRSWKKLVPNQLVKGMIMERRDRHPDYEDD